MQSGTPALLAGALLVLAVVSARRSRRSRPSRSGTGRC
ncbi:hypothetical protein FQU85_04905 [Salarchaeum sp. JOR-1]|nr:hypothetical protein FQU85_04905 [Salarchaeum sp. JOR-1]